MQKEKISLLIPTIFTALSLIITISLGIWQIKRLIWKNDLITQIEHKLEMPAINLAKSEALSGKNIYRKVIANGYFNKDKIINLYRGPQGYNREDGVRIVVPFHVNSAVYLVDLGWVPMSEKQNSEKFIDNLNGDIVGWLMPYHQKKYFIPENDLNRNLWFYLDKETAEKSLNLKLPELYIQLEGSGNALPIAEKISPKLRNDHLQYAITWFALAAISLIIYILYIKGNKD